MLPRLQHVGLAVWLQVLVLMIVPYASAAAASVQAEYNAIMKLADRQYPAHLNRGSDEALAYTQARSRNLYDQGIAFISAHPDSPLRWDVLVQLRYGRNLEVVVQRDGSKILLQPKLERALWHQRYFAMLEDLLEATDASKPVAGRRYRS